MPKSTARPTNSTANATEITFKVPTASAAKPVVSAKPTSSVIRIGTMRRSECIARYSHSASRSRLTTVLATMPLVSAPNCTSAKATEPV